MNNKDYADDAKTKVLSLEPVEFVRRCMLHVLPRGLMRIRHYGFLSSAGRYRKLPQCARIFRSLEKNLERKKEKQPWFERLKTMYGKDPRICKKCGKGMMVKGAKIEPCAVNFSSA